MEKNRLNKKDLGNFLTILKKHYSNIISPGLDDKNSPVFRLINSAQEIVLDKITPIKPPKEFLFPQSEELMTYDKNDSYTPTRIVEKTKFAIFGARPCDIKAIEYNNLFFGNKFNDPYYQSKRENLLLIGISCEFPSSSCFCTTMGISPVESSGSDLFLTNLGTDYLVEWVSDIGKAIQQFFAEILTEAKPEDEKMKIKIEETTRSKLVEEINLTEIKGKIIQTYDKEDLWKNYSEVCIACGACTFNCPTCTCFDVQEKMESLENGTRYRTWDSCQFYDFCLHASGHNPRGTKMQRLRQRILHKYQYSIDQLNQWSCTGCGRCIRSCPVGINTRSILKDIKEELHG